MLTLIEVLEGMLALAIILMVVISSFKLYKLVWDMLEYSEIEKTSVLHILDLTLLLVLSIDILRTLITAILSRFLPIRIVIEAAMIAVLREIISIEIRHLDYKMIISLTIALLGLGFLWLITTREERKRMQPAASRQSSSQEALR